MKVTKNYINDMVLLLNSLWPQDSFDETKELIDEYINHDEKEVFIHIVDERCVGIAMCCLRHDYVEGCTSSPVGYLEGIIVDDNFRKSNIGRSLCKECEDWVRSKGCKEFASDCELTNKDSYKFHLNIGFSEENRIICFKKNI